MQDSSWKVWVLAAIIAVGGTFELFKRMPSGKSPLMDKENLRYSSEEDAPYSVRHEQMKLHKADAVAPRPVHVAAATNPILEEQMKQFNAANAQVATTADHKEAGKVAKKKKDGEEYEIITDPVTGKKYRRKKKKDAKKDDKDKAKTEVAKLPLENKLPKHEPMEEDANAAIAAALAEAANGGPLAPTTPQEAKDPFTSAAEWERILLQRPDLNQTKHFIQEYRARTVSPEVYYKITQLMIQDSRPEMKSLGVLLAGASPSTASFQLLVGVAKGSSASATLKQQATALLNTYSQQANLVYLQGALRGSDVNSALMATQLLGTAIQQASQQPGGGTPSTDPRASNTAQASNRTRFQPFVSILTQLSASAQDATLASQARQTLNDLQALLGPTTSNIAASP